MTNGTGAGTSELSVTGAYSGGLNPTDMTAFGNEVLFQGERCERPSRSLGDQRDGNGHLRTVRHRCLADFQLGHDFGSEVLFFGTDISGMALGQQRHRALEPRSCPLPASLRRGRLVLNLATSPSLATKLCLMAMVRTDSPGLRVTNGTSAGTSELSVAAASPNNGLAPGNLTVLGNEVCL